MGKFNFEGHVRKQILIREGWEEEAEKEDRRSIDPWVVGMGGKVIWGLNSKENKESLRMMLMPLVKTEENPSGWMEMLDALSLAKAVWEITGEEGEDIVLEKFRIRGDVAPRPDRKVKASDTLKLLRFIRDKFPEKKEKVAKLVDQWGRLNTVGFTAPRRSEPTKTTDPAVTSPDDEPASDEEKKEKYRMSLKSLKRMLMKSINPEIDNKVEWVKDIAAAVIEDIPDMRLSEARDPISFSNTLAVLKLLKGAYEQQGLDFQPLERTIYDFLKVNNLEASGDILKAREDEGDESALTTALDSFQAGLDVAGAAGMFPPLQVIAAPAGVASLVLNLLRGKFGWALFDLITLVPVVGSAAKAGKLGKGAKAAAAAGKWKTGRALIKALGSADKARKGLDAVKASVVAIELAKASEGAAHLINEMIPDEVWSQIENAEIPERIADKLPEEQRKKPLVDWILDTLAESDIPLLDGKVEGLRDAWNETRKAKKKLASHPDDGKDAASLPPEDGGPPYTIHRENLNLNEQKYIMLLERFKIK